MRQPSWRQFVGVAVAFLGLVCGGLAKASSQPALDPGDEVRRMISEVRESVRMGDFDSAWESYRGVFPFVLSNESANMAYYDTCHPVACPDMGRLGWLLGKSRSDLRFLDEALEGLSHPQSVES